MHPEAKLHKRNNLYQAWFFLGGQLAALVQAEDRRSRGRTAPGWVAIRDFEPARTRACTQARRQARRQARCQVAKRHRFWRHAGQQSDPAGSLWGVNGTLGGDRFCTCWPAVAPALTAADCTGRDANQAMTTILYWLSASRCKPVLAMSQCWAAA